MVARQLPADRPAPPQPQDGLVLGSQGPRQRIDHLARDLGGLRVALLLLEGDVVLVDLPQPGPQQLPRGR